MFVREICRQRVDCAETDLSVQVAAQRMQQRTVGCLVVVGSNGEPVGIVTDRDLAIRVVAKGLPAQDVTVGEVMTRHPATVRARDPLESAISVMKDNSCRRVPVVDSEGRLQGIIAMDDILRHYSRQFERLGRLLEQESPESAGRM